jgi:hypothetical protein
MANAAVAAALPHQGMPAYAPPPPAAAAPPGGAAAAPLARRHPAAQIALGAAYPRSVSPALPGVAPAAPGAAPPGARWAPEPDGAGALWSAPDAGAPLAGSFGSFAPPPEAGLPDDEDEDGMVEIDPVLLLILQGSLYLNKKGRDSPTGNSRRRSDADEWLGGFVTGGSDDTGSSGSEGGGGSGSGAAGDDSDVFALETGPAAGPAAAPPALPALALAASAAPAPTGAPAPKAPNGCAPAAPVPADAPAGAPAAARHHPSALLPGHPKWRPLELAIPGGDDINNDAAAAAGSPLGTPQSAGGPAGAPGSAPGGKQRRVRRRLPPGSPEYGARVAELLEQDRRAASERLLSHDLDTAAAAAAAATAAAAAAAEAAAAAVLQGGGGGGAAQGGVQPVMLRRVAAVRGGGGGGRPARSASPASKPSALPSGMGALAG